MNNIRDIIKTWKEDHEKKNQNCVKDEEKFIDDVKNQFKSCSSKFEVNNKLDQLTVTLNNDTSKRLEHFKKHGEELEEKINNSHLTDEEKKKELSDLNESVNNSTTSVSSRFSSLCSLIFNEIEKYSPSSYLETIEEEEEEEGESTESSKFSLVDASRELEATEPTSIFGLDGDE
uniref:Uncharacterized protein n=1 Tax=Aspergillus ustus TaxID=40382 RepID=A0A097KZU1_ASPUT|nr:hypothetical protein [Aspergillus ustus]AIT99571.1 hypothetical protein [Aspergillus ustus]